MDVLTFGIAGVSGSGKTTLARVLDEQSSKMGISSFIFALDNYYKCLDHLPFEERTKQNFDHPDAIDFELAYDQLAQLQNGKSIQQPVYDFNIHTRTAETKLVKPAQFLIVEGILALYPKNFRELFDYSIYMSTHSYESILRRLGRDITDRGRSVQSFISQMRGSVIPMTEKYVKPQKDHAHFQINGDGDTSKATEGLLRIVRDYFRE